MTDAELKRVLSEMTSADYEGLKILLAANRLRARYLHKDLAHNAHGIFQLAFEAARELTWRYGNPLAYDLAQGMVEEYIGLFDAAHSNRM